MSLDKDKLMKILKLSTSNFDGEALACLRKANAMVKAAGLDWEGVLAGVGSRRNDDLNDILKIRNRRLEKECEQMQDKIRGILKEKSAWKDRAMQAENELLMLRGSKREQAAPPPAQPKRESQPRRDNLNPFASSPFRGRR